MKILQINAIYEKFSTGRTTKEMHNALILKGHKSYVAAPKLYSLTENSYKIGNKVDWKLHAFLSRITGKQAYFSMTSTKRLIRYIKKIQPDVVHLRNLHANYINLKLLLEYFAENDIPVVLTLHDCWFYTGKCMYYIEHNCNKWKEKCNNCPAKHMGNNSYFFDCSEKMFNDKKKLFNAINKLAVIGVSDWVTEDVKSSFLKNAKIIRRIYNWIDLELFKPQNTNDLREELNVKDKFVILGVSMNWTSTKGIEIFNELANSLPAKYQVILVGDDSMVKTKNKNIIFLSSITDSIKLSRLYSMSDVFVNPTVQETFGKTTAEALSCGTPVIAYNGTATPELIGKDESCGYLVDKNDAKLYYEKIKTIMKNGKSHYSYNARNRAKELFSYEKNVEEYIKIYEDLVN